MYILNYLNQYVIGLILQFLYTMTKYKINKYNNYKKLYNYKIIQFKALHNN